MSEARRARAACGRAAADRKRHGESEGVGIDLDEIIALHQCLDSRLDRCGGCLGGRRNHDHRDRITLLPESLNGGRPLSDRPRAAAPASRLPLLAGPAGGIEAALLAAGASGCSRAERYPHERCRKALIRLRGRSAVGPSAVVGVKPARNCALDLPLRPRRRQPRRCALRFDRKFGDSALGNPSRGGQVGLGLLGEGQNVGLFKHPCRPGDEIPFRRGGNLVSLRGRLPSGSGHRC